jgi:hypothetical protein
MSTRNFLHKLSFRAVYHQATSLSGILDVDLGLEVCGAQFLKRIFEVITRKWVEFKSEVRNLVNNSLKSG